eukprot:m.204345 g.204345  ORF g.204345 m.204345 type:complete len:76 (-) comp25315_c0_seq1:1462-1689(-)
MPGEKTPADCRTATLKMDMECGSTELDKCGFPCERRKGSCRLALLNKAFFKSWATQCSDHPNAELLERCFKKFYW